MPSNKHLVVGRQQGKTLMVRIGFVSLSGDETKADHVLPHVKDIAQHAKRTETLHSNRTLPTYTSLGMTQ